MTVEVACCQLQVKKIRDKKKKKTLPTKHDELYPQSPHPMETSRSKHFPVAMGHGPRTPRALPCSLSP